ncbi:Tripartite-type tricarboxylate transporter, receptor component TctC [Enhydrobacter aerosaccus]|uniref:Tripartite-type tricarboxylate transporter, receptor component TctC n=1 Tax=Enhydrobacter aerosaccus TaxID=225324 RepID=A0A1T4T450_9HYPH|nr:tripartite tricarboxylate transporter substrate-binding protein [Enhydrobacter aerosaccus]SKA35011.1 Tripartite-type tricarboxylate transporter, receptor component TctC [Enhydrobacter aerosaccus]
MKPMILLPAALGLVLVALQPASAADGPAPYPDKIVRLLVPFPAGGAVDVVARALAARLSEKWNQPVVVDNKPGASGAIAAAELARAPKDGYTLMTGVGTNTSILKVLKPKLPFDPVASIAPVSLIATFPNLLVVRPDLPAANFTELVALLKANPGKYTFASSGYGSPLHLAGELFKIATGTDILHVPFTGSAPAAAALMGGHVDMSFDTMPSIWSAVQGGKLRALGVVSAEPTPAAPELPALSKGLPEFEVTSWEGIVAPAGTPDTIVAQIAGDIAKIASDPAFVNTMQEMGAVITTDTPVQFADFIKRDHDKWQRVIGKAGITVE